MAHRIAILGTGYRPAGGIEPPREIGLVAAAGFQPELVETRFGAFPKTPYDRGLTCLGYIDAGIEAERAITRFSSTPSAITALPNCAPPCPFQ
jgi:hypothetical protein